MGRIARLSALFLLAAVLFAQNSRAEKSTEAKDLMAAGRFEEAIPLYRELVKAVPDNPGLLMNLALAEHMAGHERDAVPHFEAVLKSQPHLLPALVSLGAAHLSLNQPREAIPPLEKAVAAAPDNRDARGMLASALSATGHPDKAAEQFRKLTSLSPDDPRAWYGLGMSYQSIATAAFERLQKIDPQSPYVSALVADTRVQRRQYRSAFFFYREVLKQLPDLHGIHSKLAEVYRKTGHPDWAAQEEAKEQALGAPDCKAHPSACEFLGGHDLQAISPPSVPPPSAEALFYQAKAANELAMQSFVRLGQLPPSVEIHRLRAEIAHDQNEPLDSVKEWRAALELSPGNPQLEHELAASLFMSADYQSALDEALKLLKAEPQSADLNFMAGDSLLRLEQPDKALPYLEAALRADPKMQAADASLGLALSRLGKNAEAVPHLERSLALDDDGSLHYQLARAYQASGQGEKARAIMEQYQQIVKRNQDEKEQVEREAQIIPPQ